LKRKVLLIMSVVVVLAVILAAAALGLLSGKGQTRYNVVEVYVLGWDNNSTGPNAGLDVQFRISIDSNNDGTFDFVRTSEVLRNTTVETVPFRTGDAIPVGTGSFQFKVEVLSIDNGSATLMNYTGSGAVPLETGVNDVTFSKSWNYDATNVPGKDPLSCRISYLCYVSAQ
jgi:hypothetical protein